MNVSLSTSFGVFEWDSEKEAANLKKHGISFSDAVAVFQDEQGILMYDAEHSVGEERFTILGRLKGDIVALVVFTERGEVTRIISARLATKKEVKYYDAQVYE